jgi:hypothetical protein
MRQSDLSRLAFQTNNIDLVFAFKLSSRLNTKNNLIQVHISNLLHT